MKYCVIKGTVTVIDGSNNSSEIMIINAKSSGFNENEVEIISEEEFEERKLELKEGQENLSNPQQVMSKQIADLAIDNKKKDMLIQNLAKTVSELNIKVSQLEGGNA